MTKHYYQSLFLLSSKKQAVNRFAAKQLLLNIALSSGNIKDALYVIYHSNKL